MNIVFIRGGGELRELPYQFKLPERRWLKWVN